MKQRRTLVLLDAHAILHRAFHALPDFTSQRGEPTGALYGVGALLIKIIRELRPDYIAACYDLPAPTFRHEAYEGYKAKRAETPDALIRQIIRSRDIFSALGIPIYEKAGFEADDMLGTITAQLADEKNLRVIVASGDMDTLQLVRGNDVVVYTLKKGINDTVIYDEAAVKERFGFPPTLLPDYKGLRGDPSDNIIGIPGIGEKTATTLVQTFGTIEEMYDAIKKDPEALARAGIKPRIAALLTEHKDEALFSKMLAEIRRDAPIEFSLPSRLWKDALDRNRAEAMFDEFDFSSLKKRFIETMNGDAKDNSETKNGEESEIGAHNGEDTESPDPRTLRELQIALWLIDSDRTGASWEDIREYTGTRTADDARVKLLTEMKDIGALKLYNDIELPLISILGVAAERGIRIDAAQFHRIREVLKTKIADTEARIWKEAGRQFNINSPKQVGEILFDIMGISPKGMKKTAKGARSTRESELVKLQNEHPIVREILTHRELSKLLSTYVEAIPAIADKDGAIHTYLDQAGTATGRMSSRDPNMQNIPIGGEWARDIRNGFVARPGHTFLTLDYSQIEMRLLAAFSGDSVMTRAFREGADIHTTVAAQVFHVPPAAVTKEMRRKAKTINFGIIYGMGVLALKDALGGTLAEARAFYENYFATFPAIKEYLDGVKRSAGKNGYTETLFGRRRIIRGIDSRIPYLRAQAERQAGNAPLQGTAADVIKIAIRKADDALRSEGLHGDAHLLLQIHDELLYEVRTEHIREAARVIRRAMEDMPEVSVPLTVNVSVGARWGDLAEIDVK